MRLHQCHKKSHICFYSWPTSEAIKLQVELLSSLFLQLVEYFWCLELEDERTPIFTPQQSLLCKYMWHIVHSEHWNVLISDPMFDSWWAAPWPKFQQISCKINQKSTEKITEHRIVLMSHFTSLKLILSLYPPRLLLPLRVSLFIQQAFTVVQKTDARKWVWLIQEPGVSSSLFFFLHSCFLFICLPFVISLQ